MVGKAFYVLEIRKMRFLLYGIVKLRHWTLDDSADEHLRVESVKNLEFAAPAGFRAFLTVNFLAHFFGDLLTCEFKEKAR